MAIAIISYNGWLNFGLLGDYDALPDLDTFGDAVEASIDELVALAQAERDAARAAERDRSQAARALDAERRADGRRPGATGSGLAVAGAVDGDREERVPAAAARRGR